MKAPAEGTGGNRAQAMAIRQGLRRAIRFGSADLVFSVENLAIWLKRMPSFAETGLAAAFKPSAIAGFACRALHANRRSGINNNGRQAWTPGNSRSQAAKAALDHVEDGMRLGIGTGSTADEFVRLLAEKVADGFKVQGVPTSERTARLCVELGVPLYSLDDMPELDLTIDGADEIDGSLDLVKGGGGALLREKIVASASAG
jgi:hypothetical protein